MRVEGEEKRRRGREREEEGRRGGRDQERKGEELSEKVMDSREDFRQKSGSN